MNYNIITNTNAITGYYNFPIGAETFFVLYSEEGLELINTNDSTERYSFNVQGNIDTIKEVTLPNSVNPADGDTKCIMISYHKLGFQSVKFEYVGAEVKATFDDIILVDLECRDFIQINDYIIACNQEIYKNDEYQDIPSSALSVIKLYNGVSPDACRIFENDYTLPDVQANYIGAYNDGTIYNKGDVVEYPLYTLHLDGTTETKYIQKVACSSGAGSDVSWINTKRGGNLVYVTDELFDTHAICSYIDGTDTKIVTDAGQLGILIYDFDDSNGVLTIDDYYKEDTDVLTDNYNFFIVKDNDYIYYNRNNKLIKLNLTDFNDYISFDFNEDVNNISIKNGSGKVITDTKSYDVNFNLFNSTDIDKNTVIKIDNTEVSTDNAIKIQGTSSTHYSYIYLENKRTKLKIIRNATETIIDVCSGTAKDLSVLNDLYYIIDSTNILKIYDYNTGTFIYNDFTYYNNIFENILYQGAKNQTIDSINNVFNPIIGSSIDTDMKTFVVTDKDNKLKLQNQEPGTVLLEKKEYNYNIVYSRNNVLVLYNKEIKSLIIRDLSTDKEKELRGVNLFTIKDDELDIFTPNKLYSVLLNTIEPDVECITLNEKPIDVPEIPDSSDSSDSSDCTKIKIIDSANDLNETLSKKNCHESITKIIKFDENKYIFLYNVKSLNIGIFDSITGEISYLFSGEEKVQDIIEKDKFIYFIRNEQVDIFENISGSVVQVNNFSIDKLLFPVVFISENILTLSTSYNDIVYIDINDKMNPVILKTTYEDYVKNSEIVIVGTRLFLCSTAGVKEFVFDITNVDYSNIINSYTITSTGYKDNLQKESNYNNMAFSIYYNNNSLYFISLPNDDILYAPSSGDFFVPEDKFMFGYKNILIDNHYRLYGDTTDYNTELVEIEIIEADVTEATTDYRVLDISRNSSDYFIRTDENIFKRNTWTSPDSLQAGEYKLFDVNDDRLVYYADNILHSLNLFVPFELTFNINNIKYLKLDKNSYDLYYQSDGEGYYINLLTSVITPVQNKSVRSSFFNTEFISIEGPKKDTEEGDNILSIFNKELKNFISVQNITSYIIEKKLFEVSVYIDNKKEKNFTYDYSTGVLNINYPFTGHEIISYSYLEEPFYGSDNIDYIFKYNDGTAPIKGYDKYGNEVYDYNDLSPATKPADIKNAIGITLA